LKDPANASRVLKKFDKTSRYGLKIFSWIIYRMNTLVMRNIFIQPSNQFRLQETLLSVLAEDLYRGTPIRCRLLFFKIIYYLESIAMLKTSYKALQRGKHSIKDVVSELT